MAMGLFSINQITETSLFKLCHGEKKANFNKLFFDNHTE